MRGPGEHQLQSRETDGTETDGMGKDRSTKLEKLPYGVIREFVVRIVEHMVALEVHHAVAPLVSSASAGMLVIHYRYFGQWLPVILFVVVFAVKVLLVRKLIKSLS